MAACLTSCDEKTNTNAGTSTSEVSGQPGTVASSNKDKMIDALREGTGAYNAASSIAELNQADAALKSKMAAIQENCTVKELKEINQDASYNQAWKECMQAFEKKAVALGL